MKQQLKYIRIALSFFTRIPCGAYTEYTKENQAKSNAYFSLIGIVVGGIAVGVYYGASFIFPDKIAIILSIITSIFTTGALHEDGFADVCDGFGGGWNKEQILRIMKDSSLGVFGVLGLIGLLLLKFTALSTLDATIVPIVLIAAHSSSRFMASILLYTHAYVRTTDSKIQPTEKQIHIKGLLISGFFGLAPLLLFSNWWIFTVILPLLICLVFMGRLFSKRIGGQTGDCIGATQQICELIFYLYTLVLWNLF